MARRATSEKKKQHQPSPRTTKRTKKGKQRKARRAKPKQNPLNYLKQGREAIVHVFPLPRGREDEPTKVFRIRSQEDLDAIIELVIRCRASAHRSRDAKPRKLERREAIVKLRDYKLKLTWKEIRRVLREVNPEWVRKKDGTEITLSALRAEYRRAKDAAH